MKKRMIRNGNVEAEVLVKLSYFIKKYPALNVVHFYETKQSDFQLRYLHCLCHDSKMKFVRLVFVKNNWHFDSHADRKRFKEMYS